MSGNKFYKKIMEEENSKLISPKIKFSNNIGIGTNWGFILHTVCLLIPVQAYLLNAIAGIVLALPFVYFLIVDANVIGNDKNNKYTKEVSGMEVSPKNKRPSFEETCHNFTTLFPLESKSVFFTLIGATLTCMLLVYFGVEYMDFSLLTLFLPALLSIFFLGLIVLSVMITTGRYKYPWIIKREKMRRKPNPRVKETMRHKEDMYQKEKQKQAEATEDMNMFGLTYDTFTEDNVKKMWRNFIKTNHPDVNKDPNAKDKFILHKEAHERLMKYFKK